MPADFGLQKCLSGATITTYNRHRTWHPATVAFSIIVIFIAIATTNGVPTSMPRSHYRRIRETFVDYEPKPQNETHPEGTCILDGVLVPQAIVHCEVKSGCRAIQKTGYCCPDYKCDCEKDGKIYSNGDKLVDPETPCKVCYCQGGEILCSSVTCYKRDDCQPKFITGRCCPEYDNCPEISTPLDKSKTDNASSSSPSMATKSMPLITTAKPELPNNPLGIKIKEITKPEEIRIVDDKPKPLNPRPKPVETSVANQLKIHLTKDINQPIILVDAQTQTEGVSSTSENINNASTDITSKMLLDRFGEHLRDDSTSDPLPLVSSQTEFEEPTSTYSTIKIVRHADETVQDDSTKEKASEVVIVENGNGESKHFTVFGTKGLQRGIDNVDDYKNDQETSSIESEIIYDNSDHKHHDTNTKTSDYDPLPSASDHVYRISISTEKPTSDQTTDGPNTGNIVTKSSTAIDEIYDSVLYTAGPFKFSEENDTSSEAIYEPFYHSIGNKNNQASSTESDSFLESSGSKPIIMIQAIPHHPIEEDDTTPIDSNPAYPIIIEEDLSNYPREMEDYPDHVWQKTQNIGLKEEPRSSSSDHILTTDGPIYMKKSNFQLNDTSNPERTTENAMNGYSEPRSPGEPCLIPEWERNSSVMCNYNFSNTIIDETLAQLNDTIDPLKIDSLESLDMDMDSGSGSGMGQKEREPTTPKYKNIRVIDELGLIEEGLPNNRENIENDPKDDAESLKYNDSDSLSDSAVGSLDANKDLLNKDKIKLFHDRFLD